MAEVKVTFLPEARSTFVAPGTTVTAAAAQAGAFVDAPCGGRGVCGKCRVQVEDGLSPVTAAERKALTEADLADGWRLACQATVQTDTVVQVPVGNLQIATAGIEGELRLRPNVRKVYVQVEEPSLETQHTDLARLRQALGEEAQGITFDIGVARDLGHVLRQADSRVTAVMVGQRCIAVEAGDTSAANYGVAFDIGTTTVVGTLLDLNDGASVAVASALNGQAGNGADVVSRINHAMAEPKQLAELQRSVLHTINIVLAELVRKSGVRSDNIYELVAVGNTTMNHLLLGINPGSLALAPYVPVLSEATTLVAAELAVAINRRGFVYFLPNIGSFVGSDTVGVILAARLHESEELQLAIDIGTNGEIVVGSRERLLACSTAAGPAFEGAEITFGMRATDGAIERVWIDDDVRVRTIAGARPRGLCGSGLIDAVAEMRRVGVLDETGRMLSPEQARAILPAALTERLIQTERGYAFVLAGSGPRAVYMTQQDVRKLQLAKGAISAGISILLKELGIGYAGVARVLLAGAFGSYISPASARTIGLVPLFSLSRLASIGNAASVGAKAALLSVDARREAEEIAVQVEHVELSSRPDFQEEFMAAMYFPPAEALSAAQ
jgi:uncharacterized 2Fe-2S/4Fe-4S cluster protein (DUF4445 family)